MRRLPDNEEARLAVLQQYQILDSPRESDYDDIADLAAAVADVPVAYISFIDDARLWFKSLHGFEAGDFPRPATYCQFVIADDRPIQIEDTRTDQEIVPLINPDGVLPRIGRPGEEQEVRFYLGLPLRNAEGFALGTLCVLDYVPRRIDDNRRLLLEKLANQVTRQLELRRMALRLKTEGETFSRLFDTAPAPLLLTLDGEIVRANHAFSSLIGYDDGDSLNGRPVSDIIDADLPVDGAVARMTIIDGDTKIPVATRCSVLNREGKTYELLGFIDLTDRLEKERVLYDQRVQAENANRIKDSFLSLVSHDLKSPLSGILTVLDLLTSAGDRVSEDYKERAMRDMRSSAALLVEMINQLLNIHRLQTGRIELYREPVNAAETATRIFTSLAKQIADKRLSNNVTVTGQATLYADPGLFREALFNLISNAVKFSPEGGTIHVEIGEGRVSVSDDGAGVPGEDVAGLFRHEVKTSRPGTYDEPGTGLGLPLTMDIMTAHGGAVRYEEGTPTRFVLDFAVSAET